MASGAASLAEVVIVVKAEQVEETNEWQQRRPSSDHTEGEGVGRRSAKNSQNVQNNGRGEPSSM